MTYSFIKSSPPQMLKGEHVAYYTNDGDFEVSLTCDYTSWPSHVSFLLGLDFKTWNPQFFINILWGLIKQAKTIVDHHILY